MNQGLALDVVMIKLKASRYVHIFGREYQLHKALYVVGAQYIFVVHKFLKPSDLTSVIPHS